MEDVAEAWHPFNMCRVYSEKIVDFEEGLQAVMDDVNDARCMVESGAAETRGMSEKALASILSCLWEASPLVHCALDELESWPSPPGVRGAIAVGARI